MNLDWSYGLIHPGFWGYVWIAVAMVQTTMMAVTVYLHRDATHRSLDLHPALRHFFRFWIWFTSSMLTREWVAVHRKHHAFSDIEGDPHSPVIAGLRRILLEGAEFYRRQARNPECVQQYGTGAPDDWIERRIYSRHRNAGIVAFIVLQLLLFGVPGIIIVAVQMLAMPVLAAGVINGFGHGIGYRNYEVENASRNIVPWGLFIGGEELHNNHHAFPSSAKFSIRPWEIDAGWLCVVVLRSLGLARVKRVGPRPCVIAARQQADEHAAHAVIHNRMQVLRAYATQVIAPVLEHELGRQPPRRAARDARKLLTRSPTLLDTNARHRLQQLLAAHPMLRTVHDCQEQLRQLWATVASTREGAAARFASWCGIAEASGIRVLEEFAGTLRHLALTDPDARTRTLAHRAKASVSVGLQGAPRIPDDEQG
jgi:stearoyl-CoA desaturase (delta-9 desaturase)